MCPTEICAFSDRVEEFRALNCEVVAVSCDSKFSHLAWVNTPRTKGGLGAMNIPLLADYTKTMARDYGVLLEEGEDAGVPLRGLFIVDDKGACAVRALRQRALLTAVCPRRRSRAAPDHHQ